MTPLDALNLLNKWKRRFLSAPEAEGFVSGGRSKSRRGAETDTGNLPLFDQ
jgi:hypothetical protein